ncbi:hypothetical protein TCAL_06963 [Tigriopus californicus]|uniref:Major facilitator superfamily (MFS) profile domain-containing protein n=1 Tax=Tigriopus californicus TaxID=6832 RepID=A0A553PI40_TIGCA|nr:hypothetical protein TCAL_06963 [Tigriopus californicus]
MAVAITAPALTHFKDPSTSPLDPPMTEEQGSWFVSLVLVFIVIGSLTSGYLSERIGRKYTLILAVLTLILGWVTLYIAATLPLVVISRCISGSGFGIAMPSAYMLLSEVSLLRLRGALGVCNILIGNVAFLLSLILAALLPFNWIVPLSAIPCFIFLLLVYFLPESPLWLVKQNRVKEAETILTWLRGEDYPILQEVEELVHEVTQEADDITWQEKLQFLRTKQVIKPMLIMFAMFTMEASCGADLITFYSLDIIDKAKLTLDAYLLSTLIKAGFLVGNIISTPFMSKVGRRPQFILSTVLVALCTYTIAVCMYVDGTESTYYTVVQILAPVASILSTVCYSFGLGPVLFALVGEVYPSRVKGFCCSLTLSFRYLMVGVNMKFFPTMYILIGLQGVFLFCGTMSVLNVVFGFFFMPETQGLSLTELSKLFGEPLAPKIKEGKMYSAFIAILPGFGSGMSMAITGPALAHYKHPEWTPLEYPMSEDEGSWFVSIALIFTMTGTLSSGILADRFGRKRTLILSTSIILLGWVLLYLSEDFYLLLVSRCIGGLGCGITMPSGYMLLSEIALLRLRGVLGVCNTLIGNVAFLTSLVLAALCPFSWLIPLSSIPCLAFLCLVWFMPESPLWYVKRGRVEEAETTLGLLRGDNYPILAEMKDLLFVASQQTGSVSCGQKIQYLTSRQVIRPLSIMCTLFTFQALCGADLITYYSLDIIHKAQLAINPYLLSCLVQGGFTLGYMVSTPFLSKIGRRKQFIFSSLLTSFSMTSLGLCIFVDTSNSPYFATVVQVIAPCSAICSGLFYSLGLGPVLFALLGEIFPVRVKGMCCSLTLSFRYFMVFLNMKFFPTLYAMCGLSIVFLLCGSACLMAVVVAFFFMPETKGLTLAELASLFGEPIQEKVETSITEKPSGLAPA